MFVSKAYPTNYVQEPGILSKVGMWTKKFGQRPFILAGPTAWSKAGNQIVESLKENEMQYQFEFFMGHCSDQELNRILSKIDSSIDIIIGVGGGQCLDTTKLVANRLNIPVITISTLASTCAASSALSVVYTPHHEFVRIEEFDTCPILAIVDTTIIQNAPIRYLTSGIADTLVKWYEAFPLNKGKTGNARTQAGLKMAEFIRDLLFEHSEKAVEECNRGEISDALQQVTDAIILLAGLVGGLGRHTCAGSGAHSIHYGMTIIPEMQGAYHGELVAYGLLCQLNLEGKTKKEILDMMNFYQRLHLPISLHDLGLAELRESDLRKAARRICEEEAIHQLPVEINEEVVYQSIIAIHQLGENVKREYV